MKKINTLICSLLLLLGAGNAFAQSIPTARTYRIAIDNTPDNFEPGSLPMGLLVGDTLLFVAVGNIDEDHTLSFTESPEGVAQISAQLTPGGADSSFKYAIVTPGNYVVSSTMTGSTNFNFAVAAGPNTEYRTFQVRVDNVPPNFDPISIPHGIFVGDTILFEATGGSNEDHTLTFTESPAGVAQINAEITPDVNPFFKYVTTAPGHYVVSSDMLLSSNFNFDVWSVSTVTAVENSVAYEGVSFFPNPVKNELNVSLNPSYAYEVSVSNLLGTKVLTQNVSNMGNVAFNVESLPKGSYVIHLTSEGAKPKAFKFIKE